MSNQYRTFLNEVNEVTAFAAEYGYPPRRTPMGFWVPAYPQTPEGIDEWERRSAEECGTQTTKSGANL